MGAECEPGNTPRSFIITGNAPPGHYTGPITRMHDKSGDTSSFRSDMSDPEYRDFELAEKLEIEDFIQTTEFNVKMMGRLSRGVHAKRFLIYPDDKVRSVWDFIVTL